jgi:LPS sulfotransferase NodH
MTSFLWATNGPRFDFTSFDGEPRVRYVIASPSRSGSNMLQRALWRTRLAGAPEEYFTEDYVRDFDARWNVVNGALDVRRYLALLFRHRTSPNGVFGMKVHGEDLENHFLRSLDINTLLDTPRIIALSRRDAVRQAVSYAIARQTGVFIVDGDWLPRRTPIAEPHYNFDLILACHQAIEREQAAWERVFGRSPYPPHRVMYEDLVDHYHDEVHACLEFLGVEPPAEIARPNVQRQATAINDEWAARFREERSARAQIGSSTPSTGDQPLTIRDTSI